MFRASLSTWNNVHQLFHRGPSECGCFTKLYHWEEFPLLKHSFTAEPWTHLASQLHASPRCWSCYHCGTSSTALCRLPKPPHFFSKSCCTDSFPSGTETRESYSSLFCFALPVRQIENGISVFDILYNLINFEYLGIQCIRKNRI